MVQQPLNSTHWRHIIWCANVSLCKASVMVQDPGQTKVPKLDILMLVQKYVGWFKITVQYGLSILPSVALFQCKSGLY